MRSKAMVFWVVLAFQVAPPAVTSVGCTRSDQRSTLLSEYRREARRCEDSIAAIIGRTESTYERDSADLDAEEARCHESLAQIRERLRGEP